MSQETNPLFKIVTYSQGSYIILEGERKPATSFYIIKEGKVNLKKTFPVAGEKPSEVLGVGDFFGVISAMSQYPQIESAIALVNVTLISISYNRFGELIQKNSALAMKIIRSFSKKLRELNAVSVSGNRAGASNMGDDLNRFYNMAETYFNMGSSDNAAYLYQCYLKYVPAGKFKLEAEKKLKMLDKPLTPPAISLAANRHYQNGQMIFCENEPGNELFIIQRGKIKIAKIIDDKDVLLSILKQGDIFGEMALLDNKPRTASAIAIDEVEVMTINKSNFENMTQSQPQLMTKIIILLSERIWNAYKKIANSMILDPSARMGDMLLTMAEQKKAKIAPRQIYDYQLAPMELLKMLGYSDRDFGLFTKFIGSAKFIKVDSDVIKCVDLALLDRWVYSYKESLKH